MTRTGYRSTLPPAARGLIQHDMNAALLSFGIIAISPSPSAWLIPSATALQSSIVRAGIRMPECARTHDVANTRDAAKSRIGASGRTAV